MEYLNEDTLIVEDEDFVANVATSDFMTRLRSGPRGLIYSMSLVIHRKNNGELKILKDRSGKFDVTGLPDYVMMNKEERRIIDKGW